MHDWRFVQISVSYALYTSRCSDHRAYNLETGLKRVLCRLLFLLPRVVVAPEDLP
jgi:hypothetical protein